MPIAVQSIKRQRYFAWIVTILCLLTAVVYIAYAGQPAGAGAAQGAIGAAQAGQAGGSLLFRVLLLLAAAAGAGWFAYAFTGDASQRREEQVKFSYFFVIASFAIVTVPPFVKSQAIGSEPIGIISGCVRDAESRQLSCVPPPATRDAQDDSQADALATLPTATQPQADAVVRNQWLVNIGGALAPQTTANCPTGSKTACEVGSQQNRAVVTGGLVVPLPFVIIALFGGAISLSRRVPEIQKRSEADYVATDAEPALKMWEAREELAFQILQFMSAPLIAIAAHQIIDPASQASAVALAFLAGFGSETILLMIRGIANGIQPKSITPVSATLPPAPAPPVWPADGQLVNGAGGTPGDGAGTPTGVLSSSSVPVLEPPAANIRLAIDVDSLDPGSVALTVNGAAAGVTAEGVAELALEVGREYRLEATGRRGGKAVHGELVLTVTVDDEASPHEITLA